MTLLRGDCVEVMAGMEPDSVDAIVCDPPYGLEFMGKDWDTLDQPDWYGRGAPPFGGSRKRVRYGNGNQQAWHQQWATAALRVAKPGAYLLAFGGTRTVHRMTCALEDAGWVIRDMLVWAYAQGFPKSRASLKPAWEPIVLCRKPGASRDLNIDAARIGTEMVGAYPNGPGGGHFVGGQGTRTEPREAQAGRWPANVILTDPILDGGWDGVVGGGEQRSSAGVMKTDGVVGGYRGTSPRRAGTVLNHPDLTGTYSRFFLIPKAPTRERRLSDGRRSPHPTQKPEALIRHLVTLVTPPDGLVLDPFLGSGTLGVVCDGLGMRWLGIEREPEYADWAADRIADRAPAWEAIA